MQILSVMNNNTTTSQRRAIVMGASSGMGRAVAEILLAEGWIVGAAARRTDRLSELSSSHPDRVQTMAIDVTADDAAEKLLSLIDCLGGIDLYFHASGIGKQNHDLQTDIEMRTVSTNALGFTRCIDAVFNHLKAHGGGQIAVISSIAGTRGLGPAPAYSATKAFQNNYLEALEQQSVTQNLHIHITDIRPGFVKTDLLNDGFHYPMLMDPQRVAQQIVAAIHRKKHVVIIDRRYALLVFFWRLIPRWLWRRLKLHTHKRPLSNTR